MVLLSVNCQKTEWKINVKGSCLFGHSLDDPRKVMVLPLSMLHPRSEVSKFSIVAIVR